MITQQRVKELFEYDPQNGLFYWKKREGNNPFNAQWANKIAGNINNRGYLCMIVDGRKEYGHRLAWLYVYGTMPKEYMDHIDGNTSNNRIDNLREATAVENARNRRGKSRSASGIKGVNFFKPKQRWRAAIRINGKPTHLGYFKTSEEAKEAYRVAATEYYGDFARFD